MPLFPQSGIQPAENAFAVAPDDANDLPHFTRAIYVGGTGDITLTTTEGDTVSLKGAAGGSVLSIGATRIHATGTSATDLVGLY